MIEIGMDQHKRFTVAAALNPETGQVIERRLEHDDPEGIVTFLSSFGQDVRATLETQSTQRNEGKRPADRTHHCRSYRRTS